MKTNIDRLKSVGNTILNLITSIQETYYFMKDDNLVKPNIELEEDKRVLLLGLDDAFECFATIGEGECDTKTKNVLNLANALQNVVTKPMVKTTKRISKNFKRLKIISKMQFLNIKTF